MMGKPISVALKEMVFFQLSTGASRTSAATSAARSDFSMNWVTRAPPME